MSDLQKGLTQVALNPAYHDFFTIVKVGSPFPPSHPPSPGGPFATLLLLTKPQSRAVLTLDLVLL